MKQRPILFSTPMVQAILEGRKTMTRRAIKDQTEHVAQILMKDGIAVTYVRGAGAQLWEDSAFKCPYGRVGDVLWVRETFQLSTPYGPEEYYYGYKTHDNPTIKASERYDYESPYKWKPSIFMPKDAARIWLRITNVRVERVENISISDCIKEGIEKRHVGWKNYSGSPDWFSQPRDSFKSLWESINGEDSWKSNPWVWVVEFERIEKPIE